MSTHQQAPGIRRIGVIRTIRASVFDSVVNGMSFNGLHLQHIQEGCAICIKHFVTPTGLTPEEFIARATASTDPKAPDAN